MSGRVAQFNVTFVYTQASILSSQKDYPPHRQMLEVIQEFKNILSFTGVFGAYNSSAYSGR